MATSNQQHQNADAVVTLFGPNGGQNVATSVDQNRNFEPPHYGSIALSTRALLTRFVRNPRRNALARLGGELDRMVDIAHQVMVATRTNSAVVSISLDPDPSFLGVVARSQIEPLPSLPISFSLINDWNWFQSKLTGRHSVDCERRDCEAHECIAFTSAATDHLSSTPTTSEGVYQWIERHQGGCVRAIYDLCYMHHLGRRLEFWYGRVDCKLLVLRYIHKLPLILAAQIDYQMAKDHAILGAFHEPQWCRQSDPSAGPFARETPTRISAHMNARRDDHDLG